MGLHEYLTMINDLEDYRLADYEIWKPLEWAPGYEVSSMGRVGSWRPRSRLSRPPTERRLLKPRRRKDGYLQLGLCIGRKLKTFQTHRLIAEGFIGPCPEGYDCCHNNGLPVDNNPRNLRYDTRSGNLADRVAHGTSTPVERHRGSRLTESQVLEIRRRYASGGVSQRALATEYGVHYTHICNIVRRKLWTHLPSEQEELPNAAE